MTAVPNTPIFGPGYFGLPLGHSFVDRGVFVYGYDASARETWRP